MWKKRSPAYPVELREGIGRLPVVLWRGIKGAINAD